MLINPDYLRVRVRKHKGRTADHLHTTCDPSVVCSPGCRSSSVCSRTSGNTAVNILRCSPGTGFSLSDWQTWRWALRSGGWTFFFFCRAAHLSDPLCRTPSYGPLHSSCFWGPRGFVRPSCSPFPAGPLPRPPTTVFHLTQSQLDNWQLSEITFDMQVCLIELITTWCRPRRPQLHCDLIHRVEVLKERYCTLTTLTGSFQTVFKNVGQYIFYIFTIYQTYK